MKLSKIISVFMSVLIGGALLCGTVNAEETTEETKINIEETTEIYEEDPIEVAINQMNEEMAIIDNIENKEKWFKEYKEIVDKYSYILDPPKTIYDYFTDEELDMFFGVVHAEVGDEWSFEQKVNVANVILNRLSHEKFPDTILEVLSETTILACKYAFEFGDTTDGALFFDSNGALNYKFITNDEAHNFYKLDENKGEN